MKEYNFGKVTVTDNEGNQTPLGGFVMESKKNEIGFEDWLDQSRYSAFDRQAWKVIRYGNIVQICVDVIVINPDMDYWQPCIKGLPKPFGYPHEGSNADGHYLPPFGILQTPMAKDGKGPLKVLMSGDGGLYLSAGEVAGLGQDYLKSTAISLLYICE